MKGRVCLIAVIMTAAVSGLWAQAEVSLRYKCGETNPVSNQIRPNLVLENTGKTPVNLQTLMICYFYTPDVSQSQEVLVEYAGIGTDNVLATSGYDPAANRCLRIEFTAGAGSLAPGGSTGEIRISVNNADWSNYDQSNDYSFEPANTTCGPHDKIAVFENDELISGIPVCITDAGRDDAGDACSAPVPLLVHSAEVLNGQIIVAAFEQSPRPWRLYNTGAGVTLLDVAFSPDGTGALLIGETTGGGMTVLHHDMASDAFVSVETEGLPLHLLHALAYHPSGEYALIVGATADGQDGVVLCYDRSTRTFSEIDPAATGGRGALNDVAFNPDGSLALLVGDDPTAIDSTAQPGGRVVLMDITIGTFTSLSSGTTLFYDLNAVDWHPLDGSALAVGGPPAVTGSAVLVKIQPSHPTEPIIEQVLPGGILHGVAFGPEGVEAVLVGAPPTADAEATAVAYDSASGELTALASGVNYTLHDVDFSPYGYPGWRGSLMSGGLLYVGDIEDEIKVNLQEKYIYTNYAYRWPDGGGPVVEVTVNSVSGAIGSVWRMDGGGSAGAPYINVPLDIHSAAFSFDAWGLIVCDDGGVLKGELFGQTASQVSFEWAAAPAGPWNLIEVDTDGLDHGWTTNWNTEALSPETYFLRATMVNAMGQVGVSMMPVVVGTM